jgi:plastocyanin
MLEDLWNGLIEFSSRFIIPDWDALVALIPIGLAILVLLYLGWLFVRMSTAGPTRRGKRRLVPAAPAGIHMPGPSFAPLLAAVGAFFLVFGVVAGGLWLLIGGLILVVTLLYWGREEMRDYDRSPGAAAAGVAALPGPLPVPAGTPPAGVHIPPPSFRPILVSLAATILVAGLVVGGWLLVVGAIALVITLLGWLWDARREYVATESADRTGHLASGGAPSWPVGTLVALAVLVVIGVVLGAGILGDGGGAVPGGSAPPASVAPGAGGGEASAPAPDGPDADVVVTARNVQWVEPELSAPAGTPFTLALDNQDAQVPHDVVITDAGGAEVFRTELVTGPDVVVYDVPALAAGQYPFVCTVHPNMIGTLTAS